MRLSRLKEKVEVLKALISRIDWVKPEARKQRVFRRLRANRKIMRKTVEIKEYGDEGRAQCIVENPVCEILFWVNQPLIQIEAKAIEPLAAWIENAALLRIIGKLGPAIEAFGVVAIPVVLFFAAQRQQKVVVQRQNQQQENIKKQELDRRQQQAVKDYFSQLSDISLNMQGNFRDTENANLRTLVRAATFTLLKDLDENGQLKGRVITFLAQMSLVNHQNIEGSNRLMDDFVIVSLQDTDLRGADLELIPLRGADLRGADFTGANLAGADLRDADLRGAIFENVRMIPSFQARLTSNEIIPYPERPPKRTDLRGAKLYRSTFRETSMHSSDLRGLDFSRMTFHRVSFTNADLSGANLSDANFIWSDLTDANFDGAILHGTNLVGDRGHPKTTGLTQEQLTNAVLCDVTLPKDIELAPDRDCYKLEKEASEFE